MKMYVDSVIKNEFLEQKIRFLMRSGVLYMNKRQFINTLCASAIAVVMSACSHTYPLSRSIGIFDSYDGYKNGELPFNGNYLYSGTWSTSYPQSKQIRVQTKSFENRFFS